MNKLYQTIVLCHKHGHDNLTIAKKLNVTASEVSLTIAKFHHYDITLRESKVIKGVLKGVKIKEIARLLNLSTASIYTLLRKVSTPTKRNRKPIEDLIK